MTSQWLNLGAPGVLPGAPGCRPTGMIGVAPLAAAELAAASSSCLMASMCARVVGRPAALTRGGGSSWEKTLRRFDDDLPRTLRACVQEHPRGRDVEPDMH